MHWNLILAESTHMYHHNVAPLHVPIQKWNSGNTDYLGTQKPDTQYWVLICLCASLGHNCLRDKITLSD